MELNCTCLLLTPLLSLLIIWLAEMFNQLLIFSCFQDPAQLVHTVGVLFHGYKYQQFVFFL